jgi:phage tail-like protein
MIYYPPVGFHFAVIFELPGLAAIDTNFQEVSGLDATMEFESVKEGGENRFQHRLPTQATYSNLVLKRGMLVGSALYEWFSAAMYDYIFLPINLNVVLLNSDHLPVSAWRFMNAVPAKWSVSSLNAEESSIVAETIELSYNYMQRIPI